MQNRKLTFVVFVVLSLIGLACEGNDDAGDGTGGYTQQEAPGPTPGPRPADPGPPNVAKTTDDRQFQITFKATWTGPHPRQVSITYSVAGQEVTLQQSSGSFDHTYSRLVSYGTPLGMVCVQVNWTPNFDQVCQITIWARGGRGGQERIIGYSSTPDKRPAATVADWGRIR